jgi:hypothetical protein
VGGVDADHVGAGAQQVSQAIGTGDRGAEGRDDFDSTLGAHLSLLEQRVECVQSFNA